MKLLADILNNNLIDFTKHMIVSVSGGVDSMALLDSLYKEKLNIVVVHFNHNKRLQSAKEADMVYNFCIDKNIPFSYHDIKLNSNSNFQSSARTLRYKKLKDIAKRYNTKYILTAHHLDDLLETILMKFTRGSNLKGYAGMDIVSSFDGFTYVKPLLYQSKETIQKYADKNLVPYMTDVTNFETNYTRNRYRLAIIPIMKQENTSLLNHAMQFNKQLLHAYSYIRKQSILFLDKTHEIDIKKYKKLDIAVQEDILCYLFETNNINVNYRLIQKSLETILSKKPNQTISLSNSKQLIKFYDKAAIKTEEEFLFKKIKLKEKPQKETNFFYTSKDPKSIKINTFTISYNPSNVLFPLFLKTREDGDILEYDYGHKKLKRLLIDKKIPKDDRQKLKIITDSNNKVLWIENLYTNKMLGDMKKIYISYDMED